MWPLEVKPAQRWGKIIDLSDQDRDHLIDLDLLCDLDHYKESFPTDLDLDLLD